MFIRIFVLLILPTYILSAQSIKTSATYKISNRVEKAQILGKTSGGLVIRKTGSIEIIELYSKELNLLSSKNIDTRDQFVMRVDIINDKIVYYFIKIQDSIAQINASIYDANLKLITEYKEITTFMMNKGESAKNFKVSSSQGAMYTAIVKSTEIEDCVTKIEIAVVDLNIDLEYLKQIDIKEEADKKRGIKKTLVDLEGKVYVILDYKSNKILTEEFKDFSVYKVSKEEATIKSDFILEEEIYDSPKYIFDYKNHKIILTSLYDNLNRGEPGSTGILYYKINAVDLKLEIKSHEIYAKKFLATLTGKDINTVQEKLLTFKLKDIILTQEGNPIVFAESFFQSTETIRLQSSYFSNNNLVENRTINVFNFNDIVGFQFDENGKVSKEYILRKKQITEDDGGNFSSYILVNNGNKITFLHTEGLGYNVDFVAQNLNGEGIAERKVVVADIDKNAPYLVKMAKQISLSEVIIPSFRNNTFRLIKLSF